MKTVSHLYVDDNALVGFLERLPNHHRLLVQIFSGVIDPLVLQQIGGRITDYYPSAAIIGSTTSGSIYEGKSYTEAIVLSMTCFDHTEVITRYYPTADALSGRLAGQFAEQQSAVCVIAFGDVLQGKPHHFLSAFSEEAPTVMFAGGNAADQDQFKKTWLVHQHQTHDQGMVLAFLSGEQINCHNDYFLNWIPVGKTMVVTRCEDNIIYELDHRPVIQVHQHYLGDEVVVDIPNSILAFPLLRCTGKIPIARVALGQNAQGGIIYAGDFLEGEVVRFGIPEHQDAFNNANQLAQTLANQLAIESLFVYSCTARRMFLGEDIDIELNVFQELSPVSGFFTYGEYFHLPSSNQTLNITSTILALSETKTRHNTLYSREHGAHPVSHSVLKSLVNLVNVTAKELSSNMRLLEQYREALDQALIVSKTDIHGNITYINDHFEKISGFSRAEILGKNHNLVRHPDMPKHVFRDLWRKVHDKKIWHGVIKNKRKDNTDYTVKSTIIPIMDDRDQVVEFIGIRTDITELLQTQAMIEQQFIDKLTGLPNRNALLHHIETQGITLLGLVDIRNFKAFNDFYGIDFSDRILIEFVSWLNYFAQRHSLTVYRVFGNRFALVPRHIATSTVSKESEQVISFEQLLYKLWLALDKELFVVQESSIELDVFLGIGVGTEHLLPLAESAVNQAKSRSHQRCVMICDNHSAPQQDHLHWVYEIRDALSEGRIVNFYQPIVSLKGESLRKYEALVRLIRRDGSVVSPALFIDVAKKTRYYQEITRCVFDQSLLVSRQYGVQISVNLSIEDIVNNDLREHILCSLQENKGVNLVLEITESESIEDYAMVKDFIDSVHFAGFQVAIDDFGSGYSNFAYLVEMQADYLKIDGSIIKEILTDTNSRLVTESIVDIARKLNIAVVAEFVINEAIEAVLIQLGVDYAQGYFYGAPKALSEII